MLPLHPKLIHLPLALAVLLPVLFLGLALAIQRGWLPRRIWILAVALQAVLLTGGLAARWSGERDEGRVEGRVPKILLESHEQAATHFLLGAGGVLVLALAGAVMRRPGAALGLMTATALGGLVVLGLGIRVGEAGGQLVYGPKGLATTAAGPAPVSAEPPGGEDRGHEDREEHH